MRSFFFFLAALRAAAYVWPDPQTDEMERLLYENAARGVDTPAFGVADCAIEPTDQSPFKGRTNAAEWFRTAYHDMATADVFSGRGGIDASIGFELNRPENPGLAFSETVNFFLAFQSTQVAMADLIALGAVLAVASCSNATISIPVRAGRVDATEAEPFGVPEPQQDLDSHVKAFARQGFNATEMIGLLACGHTLGGVHGNDFPDIVDVTEDPYAVPSQVTMSQYMLTIIGW